MTSVLMITDRSDIQAVLAPYIRMYTIHPIDVHYIQPSDTDTIGIPEIRRATSYAMSSPIQSQVHAICILNAHTMTQAAQNALLKLLEEPPSKCLLILITSQPHALLETIRSRCITMTDNETTHAEISDAFHTLCEHLMDRSITPAMWMNYVDRTIQSKQDAQSFLYAAARSIASSMKSHPDKTTTTILQRIIEGNEAMQRNVSWKLCLDRLRM